MTISLTIITEHSVDRVFDESEDDILMDRFSAADAGEFDTESIEGYHKLLEEFEGYWA